MVEQMDFDEIERSKGDFQRFKTCNSIIIGYECEYGLGDQYKGLVNSKLDDYFVEPVS